MDNPEHKELRKHVQVPINLTNSIIEELAKSSTLKVLNSLNKDNEFIDVINEIAIPFTENTLANLLGLDVNDYKLILHEAFKAVDFLWIPVPSFEDSQKLFTLLIKPIVLFLKFVTNKNTKKTVYSI